MRSLALIKLLGSKFETDPDFSNRFRVLCVRSLVLLLLVVLLAHRLRNNRGCPWSLMPTIT
jgi:hypothetical protein